MRLLELSSQKFEKVMYLNPIVLALTSAFSRYELCWFGQALQSAPNNFVTLYRWGRVCVLQAKLKSGTFDWLPSYEDYLLNRLSAPGAEREAKLLQAYEHFSRSASVHSLFSPAYFELGPWWATVHKRCPVPARNLFLFMHLGRVLLQLGFLYGGGYSRETEDALKPNKSPANERIDKINQQKQRQKKHELIRQKFLEANHEFKKALMLDARQHEGPFVDPFDQVNQQDRNEEYEDDGTSSEMEEDATSTSSKLVAHLLSIARKCYQKAIAPLSQLARVPITPNRYEAKRAERYWKVLAALIICDAVHDHQRRYTSREENVNLLSPQKAPAASPAQLRSMLRYSYNSPQSARAPLEGTGTCYTYCSK